MLFSQFRYFFNFYFLLLACSQFVPEMRLGALYTYWVPLVSRLVSGLWTEGSSFPFPGPRGLSGGLLRDVFLLSQHTGRSALSIQASVQALSGSHCGRAQTGLPVRLFSYQLCYRLRALSPCFLWCGSRFELQGEDRLLVLTGGGVS